MTFRRQIPRRNAPSVRLAHTSKMAGMLTPWRVVDRAGKGDQTACKPGSVPPLAGRGGHSSGPDLAVRFSRPTRTPRSGDAPVLLREALGDAGSLFGLAPGGACHATPVTRRPVGSYPTLSPLPSETLAKGGGLLSVALSLGSPPAGVTRRHVTVEPGLSSTPEGAATARPSDPVRLDGGWRRAGQPASLSSAIRRARVSPSATPSNRSGRQWRWKALTTVLVWLSNTPDGGRS
jgi:hypothetical protein